jgi:hypothetical protein
MNQIANRNFILELVKAVETGVFKQINGRIIYSPLKLLIKLLIKANPDMMNRIRARVASDLEYRFGEIPNYSLELFVQNNQKTAIAKEALQISYNIGIFLMKEKLTVKLAFKALKDSSLREEYYFFVLDSVTNSVANLVAKNS